MTKAYLPRGKCGEHLSNIYQTKAYLVFQRKIYMDEMQNFITNLFGEKQKRQREFRL
jgi:hypothetical protein